jgi:hypothetical protein
MTRRHSFALALVFALPPSGLAAAREKPALLDAEQRSAVITTLAEQLHANYVFPDVADQLSAELEAKDASGGYASATDADAFAKALSLDLGSLGKDGHFRVTYAPGYHPQPETSADTAPDPEQLRQQREDVARRGYGVRRVERLRGNVGLIELRAFGPTQMVADALSAAMTLVSGTDALILDLRFNGGGDPSTVAYLLSHFFVEGDRRHLNDIYSRSTDTTRQYWTQPAVSTHYTKPVYVLTSGWTFSGGEECAYDFQTQKRGTIVGETTGGGANPGDDFDLDHGFVAFIPTGRAINPVTHTNWEHIGVKPDIPTHAADAQKVAYTTILRALLATANDPDQRNELQDALHKAESGVPDVANYSKNKGYAP